MVFAPAAWDFSRAPPQRGKSVEELVSNSWDRERYFQMHMHFQQQQQLQQSIICPQGFEPAPGCLKNQAYLKQASGMHQTCWEYEDCDKITCRDGLPQQRNQFFYHTPEAVFQEPRRSQEWTGSHCFYEPKEDVNLTDHRGNRDHVQSPKEYSNHINQDRHNYWGVDEYYDEREHYSRRDQNVYYDQDKRDYYDKKRGNYKERDRYERRDRDYYDHKDLDTNRYKQRDLDNYDHYDYKDSRRRDNYDTKQRHKYVYRDTEHCCHRKKEFSDHRETDRYDHKQKDQYDHRRINRNYNRESEQDHKKFNRYVYNEKDSNDETDTDQYEKRKGDRSKYREKGIDDGRKGDRYKCRENPDAEYNEKDHYACLGDAHLDIKDNDTYDSRKDARYKLTEKVQHNRREKGRYEHMEHGLHEQRLKDSWRERDRYQLRDADHHYYRDKCSKDHRSDDYYANEVKEYFDDREWENDQCEQKGEGYSSDYDGWKHSKAWEKDVYHTQTVKKRVVRSDKNPITLTHSYYEDTKNGARVDPDSGRLDMEKQGWKKQKALYAGSLDRNSFYRRTAPSSLRKSEFVINRKEKQGKKLYSRKDLTTQLKVQVKARKQI